MPLDQKIEAEVKAVSETDWDKPVSSEADEFSSEKEILLDILKQLREANRKLDALGYRAKNTLGGW